MPNPIDQLKGRMNEYASPSSVEVEIEPPFSEHIPLLRSAEESVEETFKENEVSSRPRAEWAVVSCIVGILGLVLPLFSTLAIIFGIAGLMQVHREQLSGKNLAIAGIICGIVGILLVIIALIWGISFLESTLSQFGGLWGIVSKGLSKL